MSLVVGCDTGNLSLDDIFRLVSGIDVDGNTYIRVCDDETLEEEVAVASELEGEQNFFLNAWNRIKELFSNEVTFADEKISDSNNY